MEEILTPYQTLKRERDQEIVRMYNETPGMKSAVVEAIAKKFHITTDCVYKVLKTQKEKAENQ